MNNYLITKNHKTNNKIIALIRINKFTCLIRKNIINKINIIPNPIVSSVDFSISSPRFNLALEKTKNYKFTYTNYNYLRISNFEIKNSYFFSNTNKNYKEFSLNNDVYSLEVRE